MFSKTYGNVIGSAPQLDTVLRVEDFIEKHDGEFTATQLFKNLPKKMMWRTFKIILAYLESMNKIIFDKDGIITWIWNPELIARLDKENLMVEL
jgi:hypothetical protein